MLLSLLIVFMSLYETGLSSEKPEIDPIMLLRNLNLGYVPSICVQQPFREETANRDADLAELAELFVTTNVSRKIVFSEECPISSSDSLTILTPPVTNDTLCEMVAQTTVIALEEPSLVREKLKSCPLTLDSRIFAPFLNEEDKLQLYEYYRVKRDSKLIEQKCPYDFDPTKSLMQNRRDFQGAEFLVMYRTFAPFCIEKDGELKGIIYDVMELIAASLNFTPRYIRAPSGVRYGNLLPNGSFSGMIGLINRSELDASIAGFAPTYERSFGVDFTLRVGISPVGLYVSKNVAVQEINAVAFTSEFTALVWMLYFTLAVLSVLFVWFIANYYYDSNLFLSMTHSLNTVFRSMINSKSDSSLTVKYALSWRMVTFTLFFGQFLLFSAYRSAMNAFLTVQVRDIPVKSLKDLYDKDYSLIVAKDTSHEDFLRRAPKNSYANRIYQKLFIDSDPGPNDRYWKSRSHSLELISSSKTAMMASASNMEDSEEFFSCKIIAVPERSLPVFDVTIPLPKNSPWTKYFNDEIHKLTEVGAIARIAHRYSNFKEEFSQSCKSSRQSSGVSLGLNNLYLPFFILSAGVAVCALVAFFESMTTRKVHAVSVPLEAPALPASSLYLLARDIISQRTKDPEEIMAELVDLLGTTQMQQTSQL